MTNEIKILGNGDLGRKKEKKVFFPKGRIVDENAEISTGAKKCGKKRKLY